MEKIYAIALFVLPLFTNAQQIASTIKVSPAAFSIMPAPGSIADDDRVSAADLSKNVGRKVTFCGKVYAAKMQKDKAGTNTVFYIGGRYANEFVDVKIRLDNGFAFPEEIGRIVSFKNVCLTGTVLEDSASTVHLDSINMRLLLNQAEQTPREEKMALMVGQEIKVVSNGYVLTGPRWKDPVVTFLKAGSIVVAEQFRGNWAFVRVIERNGENIETEDVVGYMNTKPLGLGSDGTVLLPR